MGNSYLDSKLMWKRKRFTQSTKYDLRSFGAFPLASSHAGETATVCGNVTGVGAEEML
jgi:hypothetical protein